MDYNTLTGSIMSRRRFSKASGREVSEELLERLGHPEAGMKIIEIAGTNGKGSTAAFLCSILKEAGFRVGMFTSPHLVRFSERIRIDDEEIGEEDVIRIADRVLNVSMSTEPTMFDLCLAIALIYFSERKCDYVILEAGLGGRLDSTAGIGEVPLVTVITRIGLDHTEYLGDTLSAIAGEKAGVLKPGTKCVIAKSDDEAKRVIKSRCEELNIPYVNAEDTPIPSGTTLGLMGLYQEENAKNAAAAFLLLDAVEAAAAEGLISRGLSKAKWPGRMHLVNTDPVILLDGAHNPQGIRALSESLRAKWPGERFIFVMGVLSDKDYGDMIGPLVEIADHFIATGVSEMPRALAPEELSKVISRAGASCEVCPVAREAVKRAAGEAKEKGLKVVACGSLYMIGELLRYEGGAQ